MSSFDIAELPKVESLFIDDWDERNANPTEDRDRETLRALKEEGGAIYSEILARYSPDQQELLEEFIDGVSLESVAGKSHPDIHTTVGYQQNLELLKDAEETVLLKTVPVPGDESTYREVKFPVTNDPEGQSPVLVQPSLSIP